MRRVRIPLILCLTLAAALSGGCGQDFLARILRPTVMVRIVNDTAFKAEPELLASASRNLIEDAFDTDSSLIAVGENGSIAPNGEAQVLLTCDGDLERIAILSVTFRTEFGLKVGDVDDALNLRRDIDFDCGESIVFTLSGTVGNFDVDAQVDKTAPVLPIGTSPDDSDDSSFDEDIADVLDDLFE